MQTTNLAELVPCCLSWAIWSNAGNGWYLLSLFSAFLLFIQNKETQNMINLPILWPWNHQTITIALLCVRVGKKPDLSQEALFTLLIIYSFHRRKKGTSQSYSKWIKAERPSSQEGVNKVYFLPDTTTTYDSRHLESTTDNMTKQDAIRLAYAYVIHQMFYRKQISIVILWTGTCRVMSLNYEVLMSRWGLRILFPDIVEIRLNPSTFWLVFKHATTVFKACSLIESELKKLSETDGTI